MTIKRWWGLAVLLVGWGCLVACRGPVAPWDSTATAVPQASPVPATATATPAAPHPTATTAPTAVASPATGHDPLGPFAWNPILEGWTGGAIGHWDLAPDGALWVVGETSVGRFHAGVWTLYPVTADLILGFDALGRTWLAAEDGASVAMWDGATWTGYEAASGWRAAGSLRKLGWYANVSDVVTDARGQLWLATWQDVRIFDGVGWRVLSPEEMGFTPSEEMLEYGFDFSLTEIALDSAGDVWVADCAWMGPGPMGQGARWFDGEVWKGQDSPVVATGCIEDIEVDVSGRVWAGVDGELWRYTPGEGWEQFPHPALAGDDGLRWGWIVDIALGDPDTVWVTLSPCGGASCDSGRHLVYRVHAGAWAPVLDTELTDLVFTGSDAGWLCALDGLYRVVGQSAEKAAGEEAGGCRIARGPDGRIWLTVPRAPGFWTWAGAGN
ncbi:MAG: hypothetical protein JXB35_16895 [Anaerolineae bacterium]|nr:hypothetical protein [Anaerolineae bacterium]